MPGFHCCRPGWPGHQLLSGCWRGKLPPACAPVPECSRCGQSQPAHNAATQARISELLSHTSRSRRNVALQEQCAHKLRSWWVAIVRERRSANLAFVIKLRFLCCPAVCYLCFEQGPHLCNHVDEQIGCQQQHEYRSRYPTC